MFGTIEKITPEAASVITRAADWLEANPDKHITGDMALDEEGRAVPPTSDKADCFCAIGRIANEAGLTAVMAIDLAAYPSGSVKAYLEAHVPWYGSDDIVETIWVTNDDSPSTDPLKGRREVIKMMRRLANGTQSA